MDWGTLVGTGLGALLGIGSTLAVDGARSRRDKEVRDEQLRRQVYGEYLIALSRTRSELRDIAHNIHDSPEDRARQVRDRVRENGAYELRHQLQLCAPTEVLALVDRVHAALRDFRDQVLNGATSQDETYRAKRASYEAAARDLREAMRRDLGVAPGD
ncbi:hypothetical protein BEK98_44775 [Streptomyces diastatochromogenes]|uniref:Uncharacterized protein n=1 Tax=Streptomyces diastatochromogenes TaxID=42236 RepID=A0A233RS34_STRDA|nr:hypothetical protein BEK98_44775 [Streptomyces diastatochromogenes]